MIQNNLTTIPENEPINCSRKEKYLYMMNNQLYEELIERLGDEILETVKKTEFQNTTINENCYLYSYNSNDLIKVENNKFYTIGRMNGLDIKILSNEISRIQLLIYVIYNKIFILDTQKENDYIDVYDNDKSFNFKFSSIEIYFAIDECLYCQQINIELKINCKKNHRYVCQKCNNNDFCYFCDGLIYQKMRV